MNGGPLGCVDFAARQKFRRADDGHCSDALKGGTTRPRARHRRAPRFGREPRQRPWGAAHGAGSRALSGRERDHAQRARGVDAGEEREGRARPPRRGRRGPSRPREHGPSGRRGGATAHAAARPRNPRSSACHCAIATRAPPRPASAAPSVASGGNASAVAALAVAPSSSRPAPVALPAPTTTPRPSIQAAPARRRGVTRVAKAGCSPEAAMRRTFAVGIASAPGSPTRYAVPSLACPARPRQRPRRTCHPPGRPAGSRGVRRSRTRWPSPRRTRAARACRTPRSSAAPPAASGARPPGRGSPIVERHPRALDPEDVTIREQRGERGRGASANGAGKRASSPRRCRNTRSGAAPIAPKRTGSGTAGDDGSALRVLAAHAHHADLIGGEVAEIERVDRQRRARQRDHAAVTEPLLHHERGDRRRAGEHTLPASPTSSVTSPVACLAQAVATRPATHSANMTPGQGEA